MCDITAFRRGEVVITVKNRRINNPAQIRTVLQEQINILRQDKNLDKIQKARVIAYLSNVALSAYRDGEMEKRLKEIEKHLKELGQ